MSNIDKLTEKLKSAALKLNCEQWQTRNGFSGVEVIVKGSVAKGHGCVSYQPVASELVDTKTAKAIALFCPANILALLDELEAKDNRIKRLESIVAVAEQRNALMREWKRVLRVPCDLIDDQVPVVIHGMVIRLERLKEAEEKLEAAEKRIAELEAREVVLPQRYSMLHRVDFNEPYHTEMVYKQHQVLEALHDAGVNVAAAGKGE